MVFMNKSLKKYRDKIKLVGQTGKGRRLTEEEMMSAIRQYYNSFKKEEDYEYCSKCVSFDANKEATLLSRKPDMMFFEISIVDSSGDPIDKGK